MSSQPTNTLRDFHRFVGEVVNERGDAISPEEVLDEWRTLHPDPESAESDRVAIEEAIVDLENGERGIPFEEFDREIRARHKLPLEELRPGNKP